MSHGEAQPSGLPACTWRPDGHWQGLAPVWTAGGWSAGGVPVGCTNATQYECIAGENRGQCSSENWFDKAGQGKVCGASCVHTSLLRPAPYYALWYPGPIAKDYKEGERNPRYDHDAEKISLRARGINLRKSDVLMSQVCREGGNHFVGITMYSPNYRDKAERLLRSCSRVGVCCKVRTLTQT
tara:strand:+ start:63 stop:611 length:549 start_codon:yes stop_codon:yes gene_type:complete